MDETYIELEPSPFSIEVSKHWYEWVKVCTARAVPFAELMGLHGPDFNLSEELDGMIIKLQSYVLADRLDPTTVEDRKILRVPKFASWWDHLKFTHQKLFKYFKEPQFEYEEIPVSLKVEVQPMNIFPQAAVPQPSVLGRPFKLYMARVVNDD